LADLAKVYASQGVAFLGQPCNRAWGQPAASSPPSRHAFFFCIAHPSPPPPPPPLPRAPAEFGGQEPGDNSEILTCVRYVRPGNGLTAPFESPSNMNFTQKGDVNGLFATPLFKSLKGSCGGADVGWNFEAFSIGKDGKPFRRYITGYGPAAMAKDLDLLLAQ
jgi:glutathione peroxidase-family protein